MGFDSPIHWLIVILVIALLFGGSRVGSLMGELGKGLRSFKQNLAEPDDAPRDAVKPQARIAEAAPQPAAARGPALAEPALPPDAERR